MSLTTDEGLVLVRARGAGESWLAVLVTTREDGRPAVSVVNAGVLPHPVTGAPTVALVSRGATAKLANLRRDPDERFTTNALTAEHREPA